jgi:hypothetical protein
MYIKTFKLLGFPIFLFRAYLRKVFFFQKRIVRYKLDIYVFIADFRTFPRSNDKIKHAEKKFKIIKCNIPLSFKQLYILLKPQNQSILNVV